MEADWEVEVGPGAPVIDAHWAGLVDLRERPELAWQLPEAAAIPALARALMQLNGRSSPVWTAKCDVWPELETADFDGAEMEADPDDTRHACGCYIDLLAGTVQPWVEVADAIAACRAICGRLRVVPLPCCRVDLVVRSAVLGPEDGGFGITAYMTACGATVEAAKEVLSDVLERFGDRVCARSTLE